MNQRVMGTQNNQRRRVSDGERPLSSFVSRARGFMPGDPHPRAPVPSAHANRFSLVTAVCEAGDSLAVTDGLLCPLSCQGDSEMERDTQRVGVCCSEPAN